MGSFVAPPMSRRAIREFARSVRKQFDLDKELWFPIVEVAEIALPKLDPNLVFEVGEPERLGSDHGVTYREGSKGHIVIREDVYDLACQGHGRDRGTVAHEGGHYLLHMRTPILARSFPGQPVEAFRDPEWQAKAFHGELLVPFHLVRGMSATDVARECGVSLDCAEYQLQKYART